MGIRVEADPAELGFDAARLERLDRHFARYVDDGRLPAFLAVVARRGRVVHVGAQGCAPDALWRIFSMTKPITSVAALSLYEEGAFELTDPVERFLPEFAGMRVYARGSAQRPLPLLFEPGAEWNYSVATDVLGRVLEVVAGRSLDAVLRERVLDPLGMDETAFWAPEARADRLVPLHVPHPETRLAVREDGFGAQALREPAMLSGGGGLVSTAADYHRFALMLLGEGELDGVRVLGPLTARYMGRNHLPGGADLEAFGRPLFAETTFDGTGFGLGVSVVVDAAAAKVVCSEGELAWGGAASTAFWVDPREELTVLFFTQLLPSSTHPIRPQLRQLVYQALVD
ncbi:MAG: beta-lactamase family protein [Solirubrobacterales bacterium]|nr:beta-lactamase family protein [Solirubrobacterales bacterium]